MAFIKFIQLWLIIVFLSACGATTTKPVDSEPSLEKKSALRLISTAEFIPQQQFNRKGELIPYEPKENPYLKRRSAINKAHIALFLAAKRAYDKNNFSESEALLSELVVKTDKLSGPWVMLADISLDRNALGDAHNQLQQAIEINKNNINAYLRLAKVQRLQGQFVQAQNTYAKMLDVWPDFPEAHLNLGILYDVYLNDPNNAVAHMQAYQFLIEKENLKVTNWIEEIQNRTGADNSLAQNVQELAQ